MECEDSVRYGRCAQIWGSVNYPKLRNGITQKMANLQRESARRRHDAHVGVVGVRARGSSHVEPDHFGNGATAEKAALPPHRHRQQAGACDSVQCNFACSGHVSVTCANLENTSL